MTTPFHPFFLPRDRARITSEPEHRGSKVHPLNPGLDWIGFADRGGGRVPADLDWPSNPKQYQEEFGVSDRGDLQE
jgi:hypothetical protein